MVQVKKWFTLGALACALCFTAISSSAADDQKKREPVDDATFVMKVSASNLAEVSLGKLATMQAASEEVRKYGQRMVEDHTMAGKELNKLADQKRWRIASEMDEKHRKAMEAMARLNGAQFDHEFMMHMVKDHKEAVALFESKSKDAQDNDLKAWAGKTLPTLREHLKLAQDIAQRFAKDKDR